MAVDGLLWKKVCSSETSTVVALQFQRLHWGKDADDALSFQVHLDSWRKPQCTVRGKTGPRSFLWACWGCTCSYVSCVFCARVENLTVIAQRISLATRTVKPGSISSVFPLSHTRERSETWSGCLTVLYWALQRKSDMVKSEKADKETLLTCLVMLSHKTLAKQRKRERRSCSVTEKLHSTLHIELRKFNA